MQDYLIFTDASADLDVEFAKAHDIGFIPMQYEIGDEVRVFNGDEPDDVVKVFYDGLRSGKGAKTTQITPFIYEELFSPYLEQGHTVIYLSLSSGLSSTYESSRTAADNLNSKYSGVKLLPIDSLGATGMMGIMAERLAFNREAGMSAEDNVADIIKFRAKLHGECFVDDLMHLKRGGRIGAATAVIGTLLNIKPLICLTGEGKLVNFDKVGSERLAVKSMRQTYEETADIDSNAAVYICDADNAKMADLLESAILKVNENAVIRRKALSPIIGTHLGPESVAIFYLRK
ncbi:MAG: DegV family protein [Clostridia bacterium]|nr:DegV family protein [Clostridia bacterium]